jgi:uncharacterized membrane-anchored protein YhcB (DUF1043 family)
LRKKEETAMRKFLFLILFALFPLKQAEAQSDSLIIELRDGQKFVPIKPIEIVFSDTLAFLYKGEILNVGIDDINKIIIARKSKFWQYLLTGAGIGLVVGAIPGAIILLSGDEETKDLGAFVGEILKIYVGFIVLVAGAGIGLVVGGVIGAIAEISGRNVIYDFSKMTRSEKIETIQKLIKKYKER